MYLPLNAKKNPEILKKLKIVLTAYSNSYVLINGIHHTDKNDYIARSDEIDELLSRFKNYYYVIIGTGHMEPIPCHFAINLDSPNKGTLCEMISLSSSLRSIQQDMRFIIEFVFFDTNLDELTIPFEIEVEESSDFTIKHEFGITRARKITD